jgi:coenzyme F420-reducing hydrogenase beta subunit
MAADEEGFAYPEVDAARCTRCGLCAAVCPFRHPRVRAPGPPAYAVKHRSDAVRMTSSSGGVFTALAERTIAAGGVVFGARWRRDWTLGHACCESVADLPAFRGSKYLESRVGTAYQEAKAFLDAGREVLFTGTPCQIAGLTSYLRREYSNLLAVDVVCRGVPSPKVFRKWLDELLPRHFPANAEVSRIEFRRKTAPYSWRQAGFVLTCRTDAGSRDYSEATYRGTFGRGFLANLYLRPSCHHCAAKGLRSGSDITIGDFWSIGKTKPDLDDGKGVSLVFVNSNRGRDALAAAAERLAIDAIACDDPRALCPVLMSSVPAHRHRDRFFAALARGDAPLSVLVSRYGRPSLRQLAWQAARRLRQPRGFPRRRKASQR